MSQETTIISDVKSKGPHAKLKGDRLNCAVLALSSAFDLPYDKADEHATRAWKRKRRHTTKTRAILETLESKEPVFGKTVKKIDCVNEYQTPKKLVKCRSKLYTFLNKHTEGTYYVLVRNHCTVIKNGKLLDNTKLGMTIERAFKID